MEMEEAFRIAQNDTRFIKTRKNLLYTFGTTRLPYVCISKALDDSGQILIREGEVMADKPQIAIPDEPFSFEGFDQESPEGDQEGFAVLLARRISLPSSKYINKFAREKKESGSMAEVIERVVNRLEGDNDVRTAVIEAPEQVWGLSVLLYVGSQVARSAPSNVQEHFERLRLRGL